MQLIVLVLVTQVTINKTNI